MNAIDKAISLAGGQSNLAISCGVSQAAVSKWSRGQRVDGDHVLPVVRATNGQVKPFDLRPDLYPDQDWLPPDLRPDDTTSWPEAVEQCHDPATGEPGAGEPMHHAQACGG